MIIQTNQNCDVILLKCSSLCGAKETKECKSFEKRRKISEMFEECKSCRSRKVLQNAPTLAIVAVHTEENEPLKIWGDSVYSVHSLKMGDMHCQQFCVTLASAGCALMIRFDDRASLRGSFMRLMCRWLLTLHKNLAQTLPFFPSLSIFTKELPGEKVHYQFLERSNHLYDISVKFHVGA